MSEPNVTAPILALGCFDKDRANAALMAEFADTILLLDGSEASDPAGQAVEEIGREEQGHKKLIDLVWHVLKTIANIKKHN